MSVPSQQQIINKMRPSLFEPHRTKFIISPVKMQEKHNVQSSNIFDSKDPGSFPIQRHTLYSFVGNKQIKQKLLLEKTGNISCLKSIEQTAYTSCTKQPTFSKYNSLIKDGTLTKKLSKQKQIDLSRDSKIFNGFKLVKKRDRKISQYLHRTVYQSCSVEPKRQLNFQTIKSLYAHPNPEKIQLINDNIPEYWKNSLRDNQNRLKRHIKGNTFKKTVAEQMLQTLKGRSTLEHSIPKVKQEFIPTVCSRVNKKVNRKGLKIKGFSKIKDTLDKTGSILSNKEMPNSDFQQVYKFDYDSKNQWKINESPNSVPLI